LVEHVIRNDGVTGSSPVCGTSSPFQKIPWNSQRSLSQMRLRDLSHIKNSLPVIVSASTSRGDFIMRKFILIAGFVLASAAAQAGDRSLSLGGVETNTAPAPAKATDASKTAEVPRAAEAPRAEVPKYVERPAVVEPKPETTKPETTRPETARARVYRPAAASANAGPARPAFRRTASASRFAKPHRARYSIQARIVHALHRHGIYW